MEPMPGAHAEEVREIVRQEVDRALELFSDELVYQLQKLHGLSGTNVSRAIADATFMARRKLGQS